MSENSGTPARPGARAGSIEFTLTMPLEDHMEENQRFRGNAIAADSFENRLFLASVTMPKHAFPHAKRHPSFRMSRDRIRENHRPRCAAQPSPLDR
jgi:hypothetical protein